MNRLISIALALVFIALVLALAYVAHIPTHEGSVITATNFVKNEATFKFDGIPESLKLTETIALDCAYCWEVHFEYQSRNSGYGDRKDAVVAPVITNHSARIIVENGVITMAVLDDRWDMRTQKLIGTGQEQEQRI